MWKLRYCHWWRRLLLRLPSWNWLLDYLYPNDAIIEFKSEEDTEKEGDVF